MRFRGVAHPPPSKCFGGVADLSAADIDVADMGRAGLGTQLLVEHDHSDPVGRVWSSWRGMNGELRVSGQIDDADCAQRVKSGRLRGLSLGTAVTTNSDTGQAVLKRQRELSLCVEPRRDNCYIDELDGKVVRSIHNSSNTSGVRARRPMCRHMHIHDLLSASHTSR